MVLLVRSLVGDYRLQGGRAKHHFEPRTIRKRQRAGELKIRLLLRYPVPLFAVFLRPFNQEGTPQVGDAGAPMVFMLFSVL